MFQNKTINMTYPTEAINLFNKKISLRSGTAFMRFVNELKNYISTTSFFAKNSWNFWHVRAAEGFTTVVVVVVVDMSKESIAAQLIQSLSARKVSDTVRSGFERTTVRLPPDARNSVQFSVHGGPFVSPFSS